MKHPLVRWVYPRLPKCLIVCIQHHAASTHIPVMLKRKFAPWNPFTMPILRSFEPNQAHPQRTEPNLQDSEQTKKLNQVRCGCLVKCRKGPSVPSAFSRLQMRWNSAICWYSQCVGLQIQNRRASFRCFLGVKQLHLCSSQMGHTPAVQQSSELAKSKSILVQQLHTWLCNCRRYLSFTVLHSIKDTWMPLLTINNNIIYIYYNIYIIIYIL